MTGLSFDTVKHMQGNSGWAVRLRARAGLDFHVLITLMFRGWTILAGAVTMVLLPLWLTPMQQGYYYTFASILALQIFFELGLNQIVLQLVSHEVAHLQVHDDGRIEGDAAYLDRLGSLTQLLGRWYAVAAILFVVVGGTAGLVFFSRKGTLPPSQWLGAWMLLTCASATNLYFSPGLAMMEGTGRVGHVARLRLAQSCAGYLGLWLALALHAGLWAAASAPLAAAVFTGIWLRRRGHALTALAARPLHETHRLRWGRDVFPLQWRIALSWASGYFIFNLFTPLVFSHLGAVAAGQLGLGLTVFNAVSTVGMSWVNARTPQFTMHIARGERQALNELFNAVALRSSATTAVISLLVVVGAAALGASGVQAVTRIASPAVLACLAWVTVVNSVVFAAAAYMRAHREEPMLPVSLVTGMLTAAVAWFGVRLGVLQMMALYAGVTTCVTLPWTLTLFARYARRTS